MWNISTLSLKGIKKVQANFMLTKSMRINSLNAILLGRPLDAEIDKHRKKGYLKRVFGEKNYKTIHHALVIGSTVDFEDIKILTLAEAASKTVARIVDREIPRGTGFMISEELFLTNNHVLYDDTEASKATIEFNYEFNVKDQIKPITTYKLAPKKLFLFSHESDLDFSIIAVGPKKSGPDDLSDFGFCPLSSADSKHTLGMWANIIQHPEGRPKQIVFRENRLAGRLEGKNGMLHYYSDTENKSSGSPVFNDKFEVIALHHYAAKLQHRAKCNSYNCCLCCNLNEAMMYRRLNEGIRISSIVKNLEERKLKDEEQKLIDKALNYKFSNPSTLHTN